MRIRMTLRLIILELEELNILGLIILAILSLLTFYPLIRDGYVDIGEPAIPLNIISVGQSDFTSTEELMKWIDMTTYINKKVFMLYFNRIFQPRYLLVGEDLSKLIPIFLILAISSYVTMASSNILRPDVYKRYMTLPISRMEYFVGKLFFNILFVSFFIVSTYVLVASLYYRFDSSIIIASILAIPELVLIVALTFLVSALVKREVPAFILSSGLGFLLYTQVIELIGDFFTLRPSGGEGVSSGAIYGYMYLVGFFEDFDSLGEAGIIYRVMTGSLLVDLEKSLFLLTLYETTMLLISFAIVMLSSYILSGVEVD